MNIEEGKERGVTSGNSPQPGVANYPPQSVIGFPQQISPSAPHPPPQFYAHGFPKQISPPAPPPPPQFYAHGYQAGQGYPVSEGIPTEKVYGPLPCCGIGIGWLLFILGFFLAFIPWYAGAIMLPCVKDNDKREKPGLIACTIAAVISAILMEIIVALAILFFVFLSEEMTSSR